jgi:hypothetical protein
MATGNLPFRMSTRYCMTDTGLLLCEGNTSNDVSYPWLGLINGYPCIKPNTADFLIVRCKCAKDDRYQTFPTTGSREPDCTIKYPDDFHPLVNNLPLLLVNFLTIVLQNTRLHLYSPDLS